MWGSQYDPLRSGNPQKAEIDSATSRWLVPGCMIGMGLGFLGLGSVLMLMGIVVLTSSAG